MKVGTKSILFGYHQFLIHPLFVARAWWILYGFPLDPRLWVAFFVHDIGYWGKPNMDGPEGELHVIRGADIMAKWFDGRKGRLCETCAKGKSLSCWPDVYGMNWGRFTLMHSRFFARRFGRQPSRLCHADKLAIIITPTWLQLLLMNLTGEIREYMSGVAGRNSGIGKTQRFWVEDMKKTVREYLKKHCDKPLQIK